MGVRMKILFQSVLLCLFVFLFPYFSSSDAVSSQINEISLAAEQGLPRFLDSIPEGAEKDFGFENRREFTYCHLGPPYQMITIHPKALLDGSTSSGNIITPLYVWRYPVICEGRIRVLLTVANMNGIWEAVEIGAAGIATELDQLENIVVVDSGDTQRVILRLFQIKADFVGYYDRSQNMEEGMFIPLQSALMVLEAGDKELIIFYLKEVRSLLREKFRAVWLRSLRQ